MVNANNQVYEKRIRSLHKVVKIGDNDSDNKSDLKATQERQDKQE